MKKRKATTYPIGLLSEIDEAHWHLYSNNMFVATGQVLDSDMSLAVVAEDAIKAERIAKELHPDSSFSVRKAKDDDTVFTGSENINLCKGRKSIFG